MTSKQPDQDGAPGTELAGALRETLLGWLVLAVVLSLSALYLWFHLRVGWIPHDAGMFAESAERVLRGQVPYRDFIEVYTGGLTYLNALAFRLFGVNLFSLRIPLFLFFLGWVPSVYFIARRFAAPIAAGLVTLLAVAWSVPNYPEGMPSWYNLFFATWGVLALIRYLETERRRWLWIAGACAGFSFLVKIVALYFIAAVLLFFVFREVTLSRRPEARSARGAVPYRIFASGGLLLFLVGLIQLVAQRPSGKDFFYFVLPSACLVSLLLWEVWRSPAEGGWLRFRRFFSIALAFLGGAFIPVALFLAYYIKVGAIRAWFSGIFGSSAHVHWAAYSPTSLLLIIGLVPLALVLSLAYSPRAGKRQWDWLVASLALAVALAFARTSRIVYEAFGLSLPDLVPILAFAIVLRLYRGESLSERQRQNLFLLAAVAIVCSLIQFPFAVPIYFSYVAPLVILALVCLFSMTGKPDRTVLAVLVVFYVAFAVWLRTPGFYPTQHSLFEQPSHLSKLHLPRAGGIDVPVGQAREYEQIVHLVQAHAHGRYIYAGPDSPQIYFLSGFLNPTGSIYDFLDPDFLNPAVRDDRILRTLAVHDVNVAVLAPPDTSNSGTMFPALRALLEARFPNSTQVSGFDVRWK